MLRAHVHRRTSGEVGVSFESAQTPVAAVGSDDLGARMERLEAEVAAQRIIKRLRADVDLDAVS